MKSEIMRKKERKSKSEKGWNREREKGRVRDRIRKIKRERERVTKEGREEGKMDMDDVRNKCERKYEKRINK